MEKVIIGVFMTADGAIEAIRSMRQHECDTAGLAVVSRYPEERSRIEDESGLAEERTAQLAKEGSRRLDGPLAALSVKDRVMSKDELAGHLAALDINDHDSEYFSTFYEEGSILLMMEPDGCHDEEIQSMFRTNNALNAITYGQTGSIIGSEGVAGPGGFPNPDVLTAGDMRGSQFQKELEMELADYDGDEETESGRFEAGTASGNGTFFKSDQ